MIKALLRNFILLATGCLISFSVLAQNSALTNNLLLVNEKEESFKSYSAKVLNKSSLLTYQQSTVLSEVRRGYERLSKSCAPPSSQAQNTLANKNLLAQVDLLQLNLDKQIAALQNSLNKQSEKVVQFKSKACPALAVSFLKSKNCQLVDDLSSGAQNLSAALDLYQKTYQSRHTIYRALIAKEGEGCIRAGFSDRLMRANESQMEALESFAVEQFASLIEEIGVLIPASP